MDVNALKRNEIEYELRLRDWSSDQLTDQNVDQLRKLLRGHLASENCNRSTVELSNSIGFEEDCEQLALSLQDIANLIAETAKPFHEKFCKRVNSRLNHIAN